MRIEGISRNDCTLCMTRNRTKATRLYNIGCIPSNNLKLFPKCNGLDSADSAVVVVMITIADSVIEYQ